MPEIKPEEPGVMESYELEWMNPVDDNDSIIQNTPTRYADVQCNACDFGSKFIVYRTMYGLNLIQDAPFPRISLIPSHKYMILHRIIRNQPYSNELWMDFMFEATEHIQKRVHCYQCANVAGYINSKPPLVERVGE